MSSQLVDLDALTWWPDPASREISRERLDAIALTPMSARLRNELITRSYGDLAQAMAGLRRHRRRRLGRVRTVGQHHHRGISVAANPGTRRSHRAGLRRRQPRRVRRHRSRDTTFLASVGRAYVEGSDLSSAWAQCADDLQRRLFSPPGAPSTPPPRVSGKTPSTPARGARYNLLLVLGLRAYYHALETVDPERKSRSILLGNCLIGLHEQRLLARAISAGFRSWLRTITAPWRLLQPRARWLGHVPGAWQLRLESFWIHLATVI